MEVQGVNCVVSHEKDCIEREIDNINNLLIFREYDKCLSLCTEQLSVLKRLSEIPSHEHLKESLCILAIQAHGELNSWAEVLPFVTSLYTSLEDAPSSIIQMCVLLHASVQDYPTCAALASVWLRSERNCRVELEAQYLETIDVYVGHVLVPANSPDRWQDMEPFLDSCPGLNTARKEHFLAVIQGLRHQVDQIKVEEIEVAEDEADNQDAKEKQHREEKGNKVAETRKFGNYIQQMSRWVAKHVPIVTYYMVRHISIIALILYILITRADTDILSWSMIGKLQRILSSLWTRMFAPFHQQRS